MRDAFRSGLLFHGYTPPIFNANMSRCTSTEGLKKSDLEVALDEFLAEKHNQFGNHPVAQPYYQARARAIGSPAKRDPPGDSAKPTRRRTAKPAERTNTSTTE